MVTLTLTSERADVYAWCIHSNYLTYQSVNKGPVRKIFKQEGPQRTLDRSPEIYKPKAYKLFSNLTNDSGEEAVMIFYF